MVNQFDTLYWWIWSLVTWSMIRTITWGPRCSLAGEKKSLRATLTTSNKDGRSTLRIRMPLLSLGSTGVAVQNSDGIFKRFVKSYKKRICHYSMIKVLTVIIKHKALGLLLDSWICLCSFLSFMSLWGCISYTATWYYHCICSQLHHKLASASLCNYISRSGLHNSVYYSL